MPSVKTEGSEISLAFGILGIDNVGNLNAQQLDPLFNSSLSFDKYNRFRTYFLENEQILCEKMIEVGKRLRSNYTLFNSVSNLFWVGPERQAITTTASKDLIVANTPISIKANSNVILNASPSNLFINLPSGNVASKDSTNWYLEQSIDYFQQLYDFVKSKIQIELPQTVTDFERNTTKQMRKSVQKILNDFSAQDTANLKSLYTQMCHDVAKKSAIIFNTHFSKSMESKHRTAVLENIIKSFFRLNSAEYIACGIDQNELFGVLISDITRWKKDWYIVDLVAQPDLTREQSVVDLIFDYKRKNESLSHRLKFHVEIRWSHGKFCGNPEAKLYKDFSWNEVKFLSSII